MQQIEQLERIVDGCDERVADGQRDEEHIGDGTQLTTGRDDDDDERVGAQSRDDDCDVDQRKHRFHLHKRHYSVYTFTGGATEGKGLGQGFRYTP